MCGLLSVVVWLLLFAVDVVIKCVAIRCVVVVCCLLIVVRVGCLLYFVFVVAAFVVLVV